MLLKTDMSSLPPFFLSRKDKHLMTHFPDPSTACLKWQSNTLDRRQFSDPLTHLQPTRRRTLSSFSPILSSASSASLNPTPPFSTSNPRNTFDHTSVSKDAEADISVSCHNRRLSSVWSRNRMSTESFSIRMLFIEEGHRALLSCRVHREDGETQICILTRKSLM